MSIDYKEDLNQIMGRGFAVDGKELIPAQDHGYMYEWGFDDLDGRYWNLFWMDIDRFGEQA